MFAKNATNEIGLREENYDRILIGNNFVTDDILIERNVTPYDFEAFWVTIPQCVIFYAIVCFCFIRLLTFLLNPEALRNNTLSTIFKLVYIL